MFLDPARVKYSQYFDWYAGNLDTLFRIAPTAINGLGYIRPYHIDNRFNFMAVLSRFYESAMMAGLPPMEPATYRLLTTVVNHWAVCGETLLVRSGGVVRAVRPDFVWPVSSQFDRETLERILIIYPQRNPADTGDFRNEPTSSIRAMVIEYEVATGQAWQGIRNFTPGNIEDGPRGQPIAIESMVWLKSGEPPYVGIEGIVRELSVRLNILQLALNTTAMPLVQVDKNSLADGALRNQPATLELVSRITANSPLGLTTTPPFGGEEGARYIERSGNGLRENLEFIRLMLGQLGVLSGVPDYVFGIQLGRPSDETSRVLFAGQARINAFQNELREALAVVGVQGVVFNQNPFTTRKEAIANTLAMVEAGVMTIGEARDVLGLSNVPAGAGQ